MWWGDPRGCQGSWVVQMDCWGGGGLFPRGECWVRTGGSREAMASTLGLSCLLAVSQALQARTHAHYTGAHLHTHLLLERQGSRVTDTRTPWAGRGCSPHASPGRGSLCEPAEWHWLQPLPRWATGAQSGLNSTQPVAPRAELPGPSLPGPRGRGGHLGGGRSSAPGAAHAGEAL